MMDTLNDNDNKKYFKLNYYSNKTLNNSSSLLSLARCYDFAIQIAFNKIMIPNKHPNQNRNK